MNARRQKHGRHLVRSALLATAVAGVSAGCGAARSQSPPTARAEIDRIRELREAQNQAIRDRDLDGIASLYERDVQVTSGVGIHVVGREAYRNAFADDFRALKDVNYTRFPDAIEISGVHTDLAERLASESGTWSGTWTLPRGTASMHGVYSALWRKRNGRWRVNSEMFVALTCSGEACPP